ncbi:MAG: tyrosine-type recombinase/integrase [Candidatus Binataceae bacterium]
MAKSPIVLTEEIVPPPALVRAGLEALPALVRAEGERASHRFIEFFTASIRNRNTRAAYARAVKRFFDWCDESRLELRDIEPITVAAYVEQLGGTVAKPTVKQHLAAIRQLFDYLTTGGILENNPAASVRGPKYVVKRGKTPVLSAAEARQLLDSIESDTLIGLRDRALIGIMVYSFARVGAVVAMKVGDYFQHRQNRWLRLHEKGGKRHEVPCHAQLAEYLQAWLTAADVAREKKAPLFRSVGKGERLSARALSRFDVFHMIKRRAKVAALPYSTCCHTFRATGITTYLENGGTLEHAQTIANHESPRTTKLYDRTREELSFDEVARIKF